MKSSLSYFQSIAVFIVTKNVLDKVKLLASKFQKQDHNIVDAYKMVDSSIENIWTTRNSIDEIFSSWYNSVILLFADVNSISECVPRKTSFSVTVPISQVIAHRSTKSYYHPSLRFPPGSNEGQIFRR